MYGKRNVPNGQLYMVAGPTIVTFKEFVNLSAKILEKKIFTFNLPRNLAHFASKIDEKVEGIFGREPFLTSSRIEFFTRNHVYEIRKIQEDIGFKSKVDVKTGLSKTIQWYKANGWL